MQSGAGVPGNCCRMICRHGELSITTSGLGVETEHGSRSTTVFGHACEKQQDEIRNRAVRSLTASQCRRRNKEAYAAMMPERTSVDANGTCWSIRSASYFWSSSQPPMHRTGQQPGYCWLPWLLNSGACA